MADFELSFEGLDQLRDALEYVAQRFVGLTGHALRAEAEIEMTEAKRRTPVKTGTLRGSGMVTGPNVAGDETSITLSFGGAASGYAIAVHENVEAFHRVGQAKFLESVILESAPYLAQRVAERIQAGAGAEFGPTNAQLAANTAAIDALNESLGE